MFSDVEEENEENVQVEDEMRRDEDEEESVEGSRPETPVPKQKEKEKKVNPTRVNVSLQLSPSAIYMLYRYFLDTGVSLIEWRRTFTSIQPQHIFACQQDGVSSNTHQ